MRELQVKPRRIRRKVVGAFVLALVCGFATYAALHERSIPEPLWPASELHVEVPREDNGWFVVLRLRDLEPVVRRVGGASPFIGEEELIQNTVEVMDELLHRTRFVEECAAHACGHVLALEQHALRLLHIDHAESEERRAQLMRWAWRHACDYTTSTRSTGAVDLGLDMLELSLETASSHHLYGEYACEGLDVLAVRGVVAAHLELHRYFEQADSVFLFDEREIVEWIGEAHTSIHTYASRRPGMPAMRPTPTPFSDRTAWWSYNLRGRYWADLYRTNLDQLIDDTDRRRNRIDSLQRREVVAP